MPATPPPTTSERLVTGTSISLSDLSAPARRTAILTRSVALAVAAGRSWLCTQLTCSRRLAISIRYGLRPASATIARNVGSCRRGEHDAMTTRLRPRFRISSFMPTCPGSEQE
jgi:hypothetical protein